MPLVPMNNMLNDAILGGYAVGYFESWDMESLEAVVEAAEEKRSPVIIGFGCVAMDQHWLDTTGIKMFASMGLVTASTSTVPVSLILNEAVTFNQVEQAIKNEFNIVTMDTSHLPFDENIAITKRIVELAHPSDVAVEAELGHLPTGTKGIFAERRPSLTDPDEAGEFVAQTKIDALAVSIGNVHVLTEGKAKIDFDRLKKIRDSVNIPLVIHGGTGFPDEAVKEAIASGVAKFNLGTVLKQSFFEGMTEGIEYLSCTKKYLALGSRVREDILSLGRLKMKNVVKRFMNIYGSAGKVK